MDTKSPVVQVAKSAESDELDIVTLSTGYKARIRPVGASLIDDAVARIKDPLVPTYTSEDKGREEENPHDPAYLRALKDAAKERATVAMDAMVMFGIELVDGVPEDDKWIRQLAFYAKRTGLDLSGYDLDDELEKEFLFKKYIATGTLDLLEVGKRAGLRQKDVADAVKSFPGGTAGSPD